MEENGNLNLVNEIMDLYRQACEKFASASDPRYEDIVERMRDFLGKPMVVKILDGGGNDAKASAAADAAVVVGTAAMAAEPDSQSDMEEASPAVAAAAAAAAAEENKDSSSSLNDLTLTEQLLNMTEQPEEPRTPERAALSAEGEPSAKEETPKGTIIERSSRFDELYEDEDGKDLEGDEEGIESLLKSVDMIVQEIGEQPKREEAADKNGKDADAGTEVTGEDDRKEDEVLEELNSMIEEVQNNLTEGIN